MLWLYMHTMLALASGSYWPLSCMFGQFWSQILEKWTVFNTLYKTSLLSNLVFIHLGNLTEPQIFIHRYCFMSHQRSWTVVFMWIRISSCATQTPSTGRTSWGTLTLSFWWCRPTTVAIYVSKISHTSYLYEVTDSFLLMRNMRNCVKCESVNDYSWKWRWIILELW